MLTALQHCVWISNKSTILNVISIYCKNKAKHCVRELSNVNEVVHTVTTYLRALPIRRSVICRFILVI
jgi:hypothetical protein